MPRSRDVTAPSRTWASPSRTCAAASRRWAASSRKSATPSRTCAASSRAEARFSRRSTVASLSMTALSLRAILFSRMVGSLSSSASFMTKLPHQLDPEFAAHADRALHADGAAHQFDQLLGYNEANAGPFFGSSLLPEAIERLKQMHQFFRRQSRTGVFNADAQASGAARGAPYFDCAMFTVVFDGIGQQIDQNLLDPDWIGHDKPGVVEREKGDMDIAPCRLRFDHGLAFANDIDQQHRLLRHR